MDESAPVYRGGSGEPLVLIHGIGSSWRVWKPVLARLEERHEVLALDLPGYGEAPALPGGTEPTVPALADGVERLIDEAGFDSAHFAGNSLGGWIALELARRGRARSVAAISPAGMWTARENAFSQAQLRTTYAMARRLAPHADRLTRSAVLRTLLFSGVSARPWRLDPGDAAYALRALAGSPSFKATLDWVHGRVVEGLGEVRCPVVIAWGTRDRLLLPRQGPRFVRQLPDAELRVLPGLGHVPMADDADAVAGAILASVARSAPIPQQAATTS